MYFMVATHFEIKELFGEKKTGELKIPGKPNTEHFRKTEDLDKELIDEHLHLPVLYIVPSSKYQAYWGGIQAMHAFNERYARL